MDLYLWRGRKRATILNIHKLQLSCRVRLGRIENKSKCKDKVAFPDPIFSDHHYNGIESHIEAAKFRELMICTRPKCMPPSSLREIRK
jgi:hypothetical protein